MELTANPFMFPPRLRIVVLPPFVEEVGLERRERLHDILLLVVVCCGS